MESIEEDDLFLSIVHNALYMPALEAVVQADNRFERDAPEEDGPERGALQTAMYAQRDALASIIDAHSACQFAAALLEIDRARRKSSHKSRRAGNTAKSKLVRIDRTA